jgi:hypothetical protein
MKIRLIFRGSISGWHWELTLNGRKIVGTCYKTRKTCRQGALNWTRQARSELNRPDPIEWDVVK